MVRLSNKSNFRSSAHIIEIPHFFLFTTKFNSFDINKEEILKSDKYTYTKNKDIYSSTFPIIIQSDGNIHETINLYLIDYLINKGDIAGSNISSVAIDLLDYIRFIEHINSNILDFPKLNQLRITYRYRQNLTERIAKNEIHPSTASQRINRVVNFYESCIENNFLDISSFENKPYELIMKTINLNGRFNINYQHKIKSSNLAIRVAQANDSSYDIKDGGRLKPLSYKDQNILIEYLSKSTNRELELFCKLALFTGARIQTIGTLCVKNIKDLKLNNKKELRVGLGTNIDTKKNTIYYLEIPDWLIEEIYNYVCSESWNTRAIRSFYGISDENYIFLTKNGSPFYTSKKQINEIKNIAFYENITKKYVIYRGRSITKNIKDLISIIRKMHKDFSDFSLHDLRATFGVNLVIYYRDKGYTIDQCIDFIRRRMGHISEKTTMHYLNYFDNLDYKVNIQNKFEDIILK